jgi:hypothetical protein
MLTGAAVRSGVARVRAPWRLPLALAGISLLVWLIALLLLLNRPIVSLDTVRGVYAREGQGRGFNWTTSDVTIPIQGRSGPIQVALSIISARWPERPPIPVTLAADTQTLATFTAPDQARTYELLLPPSTSELRLQTPVERLPGDDPRWFGIQLIDLRGKASGIPTRAALDALPFALASIPITLIAGWCIRRKCAAIAAVTTLGLLLRVLLLDRAPGGFFQDEAVALVDAWHLIHTGRDHMGQLLPLGAFEAFGDWVSPLFTYALVPAALLVGPDNVVAARLVAALAGALTIPAAYGLARTLRLPFVAALAVALVVALSPWQILRSRAATPPALVPLCWTLCLWAAVLFVRRGGREEALLLALAAGLGLYAYPTMKLAVPLLVAAAVVLAVLRRTTDDGRRTTDDGRRTTTDKRRTTDDDRQTTDDGRRTTNDESLPLSVAKGRPTSDDRRPITNTTRHATRDTRHITLSSCYLVILSRRWWPAALLLALLWLPFGWLTLFNEASGMRASSKLLRAESPGAWLAQWADAYSAYFRPAFYYWAGDPSNGLPGRGVQLPAEAPFVLVGIGALIALCLPRDWRLEIGDWRVSAPQSPISNLQSPAEWRLIALALLLAPLPASLMVPNPHLTRALIVAPMYALLVGLGVAALWQAAERIRRTERRQIVRWAGAAALGFALVWQGGSAFQDYIRRFPAVVLYKYQDGMLETMQTAVGYAQHYDEVWIDDRMPFPYIYVLAAQPMPPAQAQALIEVNRGGDSFNMVTGIGTYRFTDLKPLPQNLPTLAAITNRLGGPGFLVQEWRQDGKRILIVQRMR